MWPSMHVGVLEESDPESPPTPPPPAAAEPALNSCNRVSGGYIILYLQ